MQEMMRSLPRHRVRRNRGVPATADRVSRPTASGIQSHHESIASARRGSPRHLSKPRSRLDAPPRYFEEIEGPPPSPPGPVYACCRVRPGLHLPVCRRMQQFHDWSAYRRRGRVPTGRRRSERFHDRLRKRLRGRWRGAGSPDGSRWDGDAAAPEIDAVATSDAGNDSGESTSPDAQPDVDAGCVSPYGPQLCSIFDGTNLAEWTEVVNGKVTNSNWSAVVDGPGSPVMRSSGANRTFLYCNAHKYGDFRFIFTAKLVSDDADSPPHVPCVLFWGSSITDDAMDALQAQPPNGYTWDYRKNSVNTSGAQGAKAISAYPGADTSWGQCEMLANVAAGTIRMACCASNGEARCAGTPASEILDLTVDDSEKNVIAQVPYYLALQAHTGNQGATTGQIEEFKDLYVESPVANPTTFITTK